MSRSLEAHEIAAKKADLVATAIALLEAEGPEGLTLRRLGERAGISRTTPYLYFRDKAALLDAVRAAGLERLSDHCEAEAGRESLTPLERMRHFGHAYLAFGRANPNLYQLLFESGVSKEVPCETIAGALERYLDLVEAPLREAEAAGLLALPAERLNQVLWASTHGLIKLHQAGHIASEAAFDAVWNDLSEVLATGFLSPQARSRPTAEC